MRTWSEFAKKHEGHELEVKGERFARTISCFYSRPGGKGLAECPKCGIKEIVLVTGKICEKHEYGEHIMIRCVDCGATGTTKNIDYIGARTIFVTHKDGCPCTGRYEHVCKEC